MLAGCHRDSAIEVTSNLIPIRASVIYQILWNSIEFYRMHLHKEKLKWAQSRINVPSLHYRLALLTLGDKPELLPRDDLRDSLDVLRI